MDYKVELLRLGLNLCQDNIIRDSKHHPKCPNTIFEDLLKRQQDGETLNTEEYNLYGSCVMSLTEILLNSRMMKYQSVDIKDDVRTEGYLAILTQLPRYFDRTRGSTSYSYRISRLIHHGRSRARKA